MESIAPTLGDGILSAMDRGWICRALAVLAILCTLAILLFPGASGPYPVTHGPVTSLRLIQAGFLLWLSIALAGLSLLRHLPYTQYWFGFLSPSGPPEFLRFTQTSSILRC